MTVNRRSKALPCLDEQLVAMKKEEFEHYTFLKFGIPELLRYQTEEGNEIERYRVPVASQDGGAVRYLPLPVKYLLPWTQLCYNIVYRQEHFRIYMEMLNEPGLLHRDIIQHLQRQAGVEMRNYIYCRKEIMEDILACPPQSAAPTLRYFDEYIIRERFDYHFMPPAQLHRQQYWAANPFAEEMKGPMCEWMFF
jgi:hypothetical protein